jgi:hypothetical protein
LSLLGQTISIGLTIFTPRKNIINSKFLAWTMEFIKIKIITET